MARLENHLGVENGLVGPSPEAHAPEELHSQDPGPRPVEVLVIVVNVTRRNQKLKKGAHLAHCEPVTLVIPPDI
jgi:hypothetical protein